MTDLSAQLLQGYFEGLAPTQTPDVPVADSDPSAAEGKRGRGRPKKAPSAPPPSEDSMRFYSSIVHFLLHNASLGQTSADVHLRPNPAYPQLHLAPSRA